MEYVFVDDLHRYKRLKVTRACESCRRRKVKCDGGSGGTQTPCSSCRKLKIDCIFSNMAIKRAAPKTEAEQMDERLQRVESLLNKLDEDDKQAKKVVDTVDYVDSLTDVLGHMKIEFNGRARYIYSEEGRLLREGEKNNGNGEVQEMMTLTEPPLPFAFTNIGTPGSELANNLVQLYFKHVHPYVPILHKVDFLRRLNDKSNPISPLLLYSVFAMGAKFSEDLAVRSDPMKPETAGFPYYNRAKDLLDDFLDTPRLSTVQAQILMLRFQEGIRRPGFFFRSWLYFGVIVRMAQDLGLNKNFDKWNILISREDLIVRKRVWQICFLCDQLMSGTQGRDVVISLSNADIELPSKADYEDEEELQIQTDFVHLVRLTKILSSVMSVIASAGSGSPLAAWSSNPKLQTLDTALDAWILALPPRLQCPPALEITSSSLPRPPVSHFAGFLNILYHTILILLHRPYITSLDNSKVSAPHPQHVNICTVAANSISQTAQSMFETWGPLVFQYPLRGGNYGVYCLVAASMIHLVNMGSSDMRFSRPATDHLLRTLRVLKVCVEHSAAWELRDKVLSLESAFTAAQQHPPVLMMFNTANQMNIANCAANHIQHASYPTSTTPPPTNNDKVRRPLPKRRATTQNVSSTIGDRPLYLLDELSCESQTFMDPDNSANTATAMGQPFFMNSHNNNNQQPQHHQHSMDEATAILNSSLVNIPIHANTQFNGPITESFTSMLAMNNPHSTKQMDLTGSVDPNNTFWDPDSLLVWNQQQVWSSAAPGTGAISPVSISTPSNTTAPSTGHQSPIIQSVGSPSTSLDQIQFTSNNNNTGDHQSPIIQSAGSPCSSSLDRIQFTNARSASPVGSSTSSVSTPAHISQQLTPVLDPVILPSQNHDELLLYSTM
ncbi:10052_t:CDS:2 [Ambispora gerdemannii]|uniref:10052_t:CDS:1 n=1 Tax=Ambispora gerdemannii TaxID=144530 RepID=A0A9N8ZSJ1_9GLOM|nr:10052_t:CDS:2 [Ambispora gerdemannii]